MLTLLVTGPIGGGKSAACRYLESKGLPVFDCDSRTKALYESVPGLKARIEEATGLAWSEIGTIFSYPEKLSALEGIVYPLLLRELEEWKRLHADAAVLVVESALALDKPLFDGTYDRVLMVDAPAGIRLARNPKAAQRDAFQSFDGSRIDWVVVNDSTLNDLYFKIDEILCRLI